MHAIVTKAMPLGEDTDRIAVIHHLARANRRAIIDRVVMPAVSAKKSTEVRSIKIPQGTESTYRDRPWTAQSLVED